MKSPLRSISKGRSIHLEDPRFMNSEDLASQRALSMWAQRQSVSVYIVVVLRNLITCGDVCSKGCGALCMVRQALRGVFISP